MSRMSVTSLAGAVFFMVFPFMAQGQQTNCPTEMANSWLRACAQRAIRPTRLREVLDILQRGGGN